MNSKIIAIPLHLTILSVLAAKYGAHPLDHMVACVFAGFSILVLCRTLFTE